MDRPETRYARCGDLMIAFQVTGEDNDVDFLSGRLEPFRTWRLYSGVPGERDFY